MDPEEEYKKIEEIIQGISKAIENETIYSISSSLDPCVKRNLVNEVSSDSKYKNSFDEYLRRIANEITKQMIQKDKKNQKIQLYDVMYEFIILQDIDESHTEKSRIFTKICLLGSDYQKITKLVKNNLES